MARKIIVHWVTKGRSMSACGRFVGPDLYHTTEREKVTCKRCRKSAAFKAAGMKGVKRG